jgi:hypothetical protein
MALLDKGIEALREALSQQGFRAVSEFDSSVTYERSDDHLKVHVSPDGSFAAFNGDDELVAEGEGPADLYGILVQRTNVSITPRLRNRRTPRRR